MELNSSEVPNANKTRLCAAVREPFQILTTTLLSLLLPLSFLLLARLATADYLITVSDNYPQFDSVLFQFFLNPKTPNFLHLIVSIISVSSLTQALTGNDTFLTRSSVPLTRRRLYVAWIFLFLLQFCVGVGIEGSIAAGIEGSRFGQENSLLCRLIFFLGLHETTRFWGRGVVKPVVDDTIFGRWRGEEGALERVALGVGFGGLWWWRMREEVEALVVVPEVKRELMMGIGVGDFVGWWLYYVTVTVGMVRLVKGLTAAVAVMTCRMEGGGERRPNDDKV